MQAVRLTHVVQGEEVFTYFDKVHGHVAIPSVVGFLEVVGHIDRVGSSWRTKCHSINMGRFGGYRDFRTRKEAIRWVGTEARLAAKARA